MMEFIIPADKEDLVSGTEGGFTVRSTYDVASMSEYSLNSAADDACRRLASRDPLSILENEVFDPLFSMVNSFNALSSTVKATVWHGILSGMQQLGTSLPSVLEDTQAGSTDIAPTRNALKMLAALWSWASIAAEAEATKTTKHIVDEPKKKGGKKAANNNIEKDQAWDWEKERLRGVTVVGALVAMELPRLWPMACAEEQFVTLLTRPTYNFLENPSISKNCDTRAAIFALIGTLVQRYNHGLSAVTSIIHLLPHFEHLAGTMASLVHVIASEYDSPRIVGDVIREIGRMDPAELSRDTSGARAYAQFLTDCGESIPTAVLPHVSLLMGLLDGEAYCMRNAVLSILGAIVRLALLNDRTPEAVSSRDQFLDILETRFHDTSAYVRSRVCQVWEELVDARAVPLTRMRTLTTTIAARLEDKSSIVRKNAITLLTQMIKKNPYSDKLDSAKIKNNLKQAQQTLTDFQGTSESAPQIEEDNLEAAAAAAKAAAEKSVDQDQLNQQRVLVQYLTDSLFFAEQLDGIINIAAQLLGSKTSSDVKEIIEFFVTSAEFALSGAIVGIRKMLALMWSKDPEIKQAAMDAYKRLYLTPDPAVHPTPKARHAIIARNLIDLTAGASLGDLSSMEEMVCAMMKADAIPSAVVKLLVDIASQKVPGTSDMHSRGALIVLGMAAAVTPDIVRENLTILVTIGFGPRAKADMLFMRDACVALQKLSPNTKSTDASARLPTNHTLFERMIETLVACEPLTPGWLPAAEQAINTMYKLAEKPDVLAAILLRALSRRIAPSMSVSDAVNNEESPAPTVALTQLFFALGHVALKQLVHAEAIQEDIKRARAAEHEKSVKSKKDAAEDEMGVAAAADDAEAEHLQHMCEQDLVMGTSLLASYAPLISTVVRNPQSFADEQLQTAATLALCKYMCINVAFCEPHLQLLFTVMRTSPSPTIRANCIVCMGDLAFRFPNLIEPWTPQLYAMLRDTDNRVRKNALMVLTHLILNDMVKVKGQISAMAICLEDTDRRIADLACLFFHELSGKCNAIYNLLPDIISQIADPSANVTPEQFCNIMTHLFGFVKKEKQCEGLVEKLCHRFRATSDLQQWRHMSFCLSLVSYTDKGVKKLVENFACFEDKLGDEEIYANFTELLSKAKKFAGAELKGALAELEARISEKHQIGAENETATAKAVSNRHRARQLRAKQGAPAPEDEEASTTSSATTSATATTSAKTKAKAKPVTSRGKAAAAAAVKGSKARGAKKPVVDESDQDDLLDDDDDVDVDGLIDDAENVAPPPTKKSSTTTKKGASAPATKAATKAAPAASRRRVVIESDDDDLM